MDRQVHLAPTDNPAHKAILAVEVHPDHLVQSATLVHPAHQAAQAIQGQLAKTDNAVAATQGVQVNRAHQAPLGNQAETDNPAKLAAKARQDPLGHQAKMATLAPTDTQARQVAQALQARTLRIVLAHHARRCSCIARHKHEREENATQKCLNERKDRCSNIAIVTLLLLYFSMHKRGEMVKKITT